MNMPVATRLHLPSFWLVVLLASVMLALLAHTFYKPVVYFLKVMGEHENNYGYLVLGLGLFVLWRRLPLLLRQPHAPSWWGTAVVGVAVLLMVLGELGFMKRLSYGAFFMVVGGMLVAYFGRASIPLLIAPFAAFALAVPVPGYLAVQLSTSLQQVSSVIGAHMLQLAGVPVFRNGNIIDLGVYQMQVAEACSGLRYLFPLLIIAIVLVWLARAPWWGKVVTLLVVTPMTVLLNSFRIAMTGVLVDLRSVEAAQGFMHFFEGWLIFLLALLILATILCTTTWLAYGIAHPSDVLDFDRIEGHALLAADASGARRGLPSPLTAPVLVGLMVLAVGAIALQPLATRPQVTPDRPSLWTCPLSMDGYRGTLRSIDADTRRALGSTDELLADFVPTDSVGQPLNLWVAYYGSQTQGAAIHSPKECLPSGGWEYEQLERRAIDVASVDDGRPFRVNQAVAVNGAARIALVYWIDGRGRRLANEFMNKIYNLYDTITIARSDAALVRMTTSIAADESDAEAFERLYAFVDTMYPELEPYIGR